MKTTEMTREQISALADSELSESHLDIALAALRQPQAQADWEIYHQIGDVLRSDDMAVTLSPGFAARMAVRLEQEPVIVAHPASSPSLWKSSTLRAGVSVNRSMRRWAIPGMMASAAIAVAAFVATPQWMAISQRGGGIDVATTASSVADSAASVKAVSVSASVPDQGTVIAASIPEGVVLRDPRIDDYLLAHQRFSPSVYSTAQFARSAAFATDSDK